MSCFFDTHEVTHARDCISTIRTEITRTNNVDHIGHYKVVRTCQIFKFCDHGPAYKEVWEDLHLFVFVAARIWPRLKHQNISVVFCLLGTHIN
jgi:hypothetical protein